MHPVHDLQDLISVLLKQYDPEASVIIMPEAPKIALRVNGKE
jgi:hypothetical protein